MRGLICAGSSVHSILAGLKTETRRELKEQPPEGFNKIKYVKPVLAVNDTEVWFGPDIWIPEPMQFVSKIPYPVGTKLYIKEAFYKDCVLDALGNPDWYFAGYAADGIKKGYKACSPMFMPEKNSRCHVQVTAVRAERVQKISEADAIAEGMIAGVNCVTPISGYAALFERINGPGSWASNPYVFVYTFKVIFMSRCYA